jgi:hypothetical protein
MIWVVKQYISKHHFRLGVTASLAWHRLDDYHLLAGKRLNQHGRGGFREAVHRSWTEQCNYSNLSLQVSQHGLHGHAPFDRNQKEILRALRSE